MPAPSINFADCLLIVSNMTRPISAWFGFLFISVLSQQAGPIVEIDDSMFSLFKTKKTRVKQS